MIRICAALISGLPLPRYSVGADPRSTQMSGATVAAYARCVTVRQSAYFFDKDGRSGIVVATVFDVCAASFYSARLTSGALPAWQRGVRGRQKQRRAFG